MNEITDYFKNNYKIILFITLGILFFIIIGVSFVNSNKVNNQFNNISNNYDYVIKTLAVDIYFFYATWCPHCKTALPKWESFSNSVNGKVINGCIITTHTIDCTNSEDPNVIHYINKFDVKGFPTVKALVDNKIINFDAKINENTLNLFLQQFEK